MYGVWQGKHGFFWRIEGSEWYGTIFILSNITNITYSLFSWCVCINIIKMLSNWDRHDDSLKVQKPSKPNCIHLSLCSRDKRFTGQQFSFIKRFDCDLEVVTWGDLDHGGDITSVEALQRGASIRRIQSTTAAFAAIQFDATVVAWGDPKFGGDASDLDVADVMFVNLRICHC